MRYLSVLVILICGSCKELEKEGTQISNPISQVVVEPLPVDSISIRAIEIYANELMYAGSNGNYGHINNLNGVGPVHKGTVSYINNKPAFRSIGATNDAFFLLSIASPALLYRYDKLTHDIELIYTEKNQDVFYNAMAFWNDQEGIAMGDPTDGCLSLLVTRDGGISWKKVNCSLLPPVYEGEAAFAASNTNIEVLGDYTWIISGGTQSRVFYSGNKGQTWQVYDTPIIQGTSTQGGYSMDFYDESKGIIYGGDYKQPADNQSNIVITNDGGETWNLIAQGANCGYKSCVQYVPNSKGREIIATGFTGISYSRDGGENWSSISDLKFLTLRFLNDSVAYAGGKNMLARLVFRRKN